MQFLNARQRAALALWAYHDAGIPEIAKAIGLDVNAAHQLLHRAKINLRKKMEHLGYE
jgi:RNA polymerase sigma-70 factor (ECF subfamily)